MSLTDSPDCLFRADKLHMPAADDCNIFDQVFDQKLYEAEYDDDDFQILADDPGYFATDYLTDHYPRLPSLSGSISHETSQEHSPPPQPWRKGVWCLNQGSLDIEKTRKPAVATVSAAELLNDQGLLIQNPTSPLVSPETIATKRFVTSPNAVDLKHNANFRLALSREATLSPSPMYGQLPLQAKMEQVESWQQDFKNFNIQTQQAWQPEQLSSSLNHNHTHNNRTPYVNNVIVAKNAGAGSLPLPSNGSNNLLYHAANAEKVIDPGLLYNNDKDSTVQAHPQKPAPPHTFDQTFDPTSTSESLNSSDVSHQSSHDTMPHSLSSGLSSNGFHSVQMNQHQDWWSPDIAPTTPGWAPIQRESFSGIAAPTPKRAATHSYAESIDRQTEGLGIHYPSFGTSVHHGAATFYPSIEAASPTRAPYSPICSQDLPAGIPPVPPLPFPTNSQAFRQTSPFHTPHTNRRSPTRLASPPISPLSGNHRSQRQNRSPSRQEHAHNHHRRKSIHKPGPIRSNTIITNLDDPLPSANSYSSATAHSASTTRARSRSHSKAPRTPKTPKTPSTHSAAPGVGAGGSNFNGGAGGGGGSGVGSIDFVNFTARDSAKLLSDVAPSGSSKTRARREAEAREKRKKLGEAALRAVSSAGGDVEALRRAILA